LQGRLLTGLPIIVFLASILLLLLYIRRAVRARHASASLVVSNTSDPDRAAFQEKIRADLGEVW